MPENIIDIAKWKENYPFLNEFSTMYDEFDNTVEGDEKESNYDFLCDQIVRLSNGNLGKHKNVCMKLMRNLGHRSSNPKFLYPTQDRCNILYNWIYNSINKHSIPPGVIIKCYDDYTQLKNVMDNKYICPYYSYDNIYEEPINIIMLQIFESSMKIIKDNFIDEYDSVNLRCKKYVCELVNIYNIMHSRYCLNAGENDIKLEKTCELLNNFKRTYMWYFFKDRKLSDNIPSLDDVQNEYKTKCLSNEQIPTLTMVLDGNTDAFSSSTERQDEKTDRFMSSSQVNNEIRDSPISSTVSTSLGAVAGASSVLALLYKFTPGRNWIRSGIGGNRRRINSNLYEDGPNELLFEGFEGRDMSSYNPTYNVGYGSV